MFGMYRMCCMCACLFVCMCAACAIRTVDGACVLRVLCVCVCTYCMYGVDGTCCMCVLFCMCGVDEYGAIVVLVVFSVLAMDPLVMVSKSVQPCASIQRKLYMSHLVAQSLGDRGTNIHWLSGN